MCFGAIARPSLSPTNLNSHQKAELLKATTTLRPMEFFAWKLRKKSMPKISEVLPEIVASSRDREGRKTRSCTKDMPD